MDGLINGWMDGHVARWMVRLKGGRHGTRSSIREGGLTMMVDEWGWLSDVLQSMVNTHCVLLHTFEM